MEEFCKAYKKHPIVWAIFIFFIVGWSLASIIFYDPSSENPMHQKGHHSPTMGLFILSVFYFLVNLTLGFISKKENIYLKLSAYIGISLIIFIAIANDLST